MIVMIKCIFWAERAGPASWGDVTTEGRKWGAVPGVWVCELLWGWSSGWAAPPPGLGACSGSGSPALHPSLLLPGTDQKRSSLHRQKMQHLGKLSSWKRSRRPLKITSCTPCSGHCSHHKHTASPTAAAQGPALFLSSCCIRKSN